MDTFSSFKQNLIQYVFSNLGHLSFNEDKQKWEFQYDEENTYECEYPCTTEEALIEGLLDIQRTYCRVIDQTKDNPDYFNNKKDLMTNICGYYNRDNNKEKSYSALINDIEQKTIYKTYYKLSVTDADNVMVCFTDDWGCFKAEWLRSDGSEWVVDGIKAEDKCFMYSDNELYSNNFGTCPDNVMYLALYSFDAVVGDITSTDYSSVSGATLEAVPNIDFKEHRITYTVNISAAPAVLVVYAKNGNIRSCSLDAQKFVDTDGVVTYKAVYRASGAQTIDIFTYDINEELVIKNASNCSLANRTVVW